ncbi:MAG: hypothetical protein ACKPKO_21325 [Candidatus Fonsibacter sp.]
MIHDIAIESGLPPNDVMAIWGWSVVELKQSLNNEGVYIRSTARKPDLVRQMCIVLGRKPKSRYGSPMSVDSKPGG